MPLFCNTPITCVFTFPFCHTLISYTQVLVELVSRAIMAGLEIWMNCVTMPTTLTTLTPMAYIHHIAQKTTSSKTLLERCPHFRGCYVQASMELYQTILTSGETTMGRDWRHSLTPRPLGITLSLLPLMTWQRSSWAKGPASPT